MESGLLQFDLLALGAKVFSPLFAVKAAVLHMISATVALFKRPTLAKIPAASPLAALKTSNLLDGLSEKQLDEIRSRLSSGAAIREDNASAKETIDRRFGIKPSAKTEYQDFKAVRPH